MARVGGSGKRLTLAAAPVTGYPLAMACWGKVANQTAFHRLMQLEDGIGGDMHFLQIDSTTDRINAGSRGGDTGSTSYAVSSTALTTGVWFHAAGIWVSDTSRHAFTNGGGKVSNTDSEVVAGLGYFNLLALRFGGASTWYSDDTTIAEAAVWDLSVCPGATDADKAAWWETNILPGLAAGWTPDHFRKGLAGYWPLGGFRGEHDRDLSGNGYDLTATGSPTWADHAGKIIYPSPALWIPGEDASATPAIQLPTIALSI